MMTDPTNHRLAGQSWLDNAIDWYGQIDDSDPWEKTTASALIAGVFFLAARDEDLAGEEQHGYDLGSAAWRPPDVFDVEEQHQSEKFESTPLAPVELDEDNPDTLAEDDTIEQPRYQLGHIPDADIVEGLASTWDQEPKAGRTDFYGKRGPWDVA